tara:strand:- start:984 stop:1400 length:417 start_codon:yes stop_codon:yes gene_type:complete
MEYMTWVAIFLSLLFAMFSDELKQLKIVVFTRGGSIKERLASSREELISKYRECPIYRSHSNVLAIKSLLLGILYFITFLAFSIFDMALSIREEQLKSNDLSFTQTEFSVIAIALTLLTVFYLLSAGFRMRCHNKASQ